MSETTTGIFRGNRCKKNSVNAGSGGGAKISGLYFNSSGKLKIEEGGSWILGWSVSKLRTSKTERKSGRNRPLVFWEKSGVDPGRRKQDAAGSDNELAFGTGEEGRKVTVT